MTAPTLRTASLRRRLSLWVLGLLAVLLVVLGVTVDLVLGANLRSDLRQRLVDRAEIAAELVAQGRTDEEVLDAVTGDTVQAQIETADGQQVGELERPRPGPPGRPGPPPRQGAVVDTGDAYVLQTELADGARLTLLADQGPITDAVTQLRWVLVVGAAATLALAAVLVSATVGLGLRPLGRMTAVARSITSGDRGRRLRPDRPHTELGATAAAFDDMLDELEGAERTARRAESGMRDLLGDAAHELRTPLAAVQASVETVLRTDPDRDRREELLAGAVRELQRSGRLVADLLDVTRFDSGDPPPLDRRPTDLLALARGSAQRVGGPVAVTGDPVTAEVDPDRVGQVLDNLLRNAVRAAGPAGHVEVLVRAEGEHACLDVVDDGPGVPADQRERVFDRLVRLDAARSRDGGAGLGLPIARALARAHGGDVVCLPVDRGACFRVQLPVTAVTS
ncbi:cell wall metabolism sensor histidine kinase WalK [Klenkia sp. PcliD-1-E]|uniref:sensor histidine kinase n=1 Tax=Klenkia sp. PcliD-1-E TaxID=2954492 RepID=UPI00209855F3|nr:HAMP domain-containing sensor histidine kinase [Klenkia sp. PcliD-1-E]MCO7219197.1 HAMP domain-containing histidine kinase [Klenkia sp. PcliD-1-E]